MLSFCFIVRDLISAYTKKINIGILHSNKGKKKSLTVKNVIIKMMHIPMMYNQFANDLLGCCDSFSCLFIVDF